MFYFFRGIFIEFKLYVLDFNILVVNCCYFLVGVVVNFVYRGERISRLNYWVGCVLEIVLLGFGFFIFFR